MQPHQILVVDDDPYVRRLVTVILEKHGYAVRAAKDGAQALAVIASNRIDVVLLDVHMPTLDGPGFVAALAERQVRLPIIVMSGFAGSLQWSRSIAAAGVLVKPFNMSELVAAVKLALQPTLSL